MTDRERMLRDMEAQLDSDPAQWELRRIYADLLDEEGCHLESRAQRWMVAMRKCPMHQNAWDLIGYAWVRDDNPMYIDIPEDTEDAYLQLVVMAKLPCDLYRAIDHTRGQYWIMFDSRREAEDALAVVLTNEDCRLALEEVTT